MSHHPLISAELCELWEHIDEALTCDEDARQQLHEAGYTAGSHEKLTAFVKGEDMPEVPWQLTALITPLQKFYEARLSAAAAETDRAMTRYRALNMKVTQIGKYKNEQLEDLLSRHSHEAFTNDITRQSVQEKINLIHWVLKDPLLKQYDPAFDKRGMEM